MDGVAFYSTFEVRLRAVEAVERGMPQGQVALTFGIDRSTFISLALQVSARRH